MLRYLTLSFLMAASTAWAEWTHRYPQADGFNHQVYLEGYELPVHNAGPMDPAPAPDGSAIAFSARGWLWLMDPATGAARRITTSPAMDARPEWSPDATRLVFVRDDGRSLRIVMRNVASGEERVLVDSDAIHLDPVFAPDGRSVYYASGESGTIELWRVSLDTGARTRISAVEPGTRTLKRRPLVLAPDSLLLYLNKRNTRDSLELLNLHTGDATVLTSDRITAQADMALSPDGRYLAYVWPYDGGWELRLLPLAAPDTSVLLTQSLGLPLAPAFSHDGRWVYFSEADESGQYRLKRIRVTGGPVQPEPVSSWDWGVPTGRLVLRTEIGGDPAPVRLHAVDADGHPVFPTDGGVRSEGQHGRVFFHSDGEIELEVPAGKVTVAAVQGLETAETVLTTEAAAGVETRVTLELDRLWDASAHGWYAGDNHFHLNYGGTYRLEPEDIVTHLRAEGMDMAWPLLANLHHRFLQQGLWGWRSEGPPHIAFGQEVRSHFLGHLQLLGMDTLFWPWIWGPFYEVYSGDDRTNAEALRHAREGGGLGGYVHPVSVAEPFSEDGLESVPIGFVADAVLGEVDIIELACLWTDEIGTAALWHRVLNLGVTLAPSAGSDVMNDYYRTMAIGATRVYVRPEGELTPASYLEALEAGRSFVTNGPLLEFEIGGQGPGGVIVRNGDAAGDAAAEWKLAVHSALVFDSVEIIVNGEVVDTLDGGAAGSTDYSGAVDTPAGGWITARVTGRNTGWPALDSYLYAETAPVWFGSRGSTDPVARRAAAADLLRALEVSERRLREGYGSTPIPRLLEHFQRARVRLEEMADG